MSIVINIFAGPHAGKSTLAAGLFFEMKRSGISCELVTEFAKDSVWDGRFQVLRNQVIVLGEQWHRVWRLEGQVDAIITDSPVILSSVYGGADYPQAFHDLCMWCHSRMESINVFVRRPDCPHSTIGRVHGEEDSRKLDLEIRSVLESNRIDYIESDPDENGIRAIIESYLASADPSGKRLA